MIVIYKSSPVFYHMLGRWVVSAPFFTLPNLIAGREIVPEFVPHFGDAEPIVQMASRLIEDESLLERQRSELGRVADAFRDKHAAQSAAEAVMQLAGLTAAPS